MQQEGRLHEWVFNMRTGAVRERVLDSEMPGEFPVINTAYTCHKNRYVYWSTFCDPSDDMAMNESFAGVAKFDIATGKRVSLCVESQVFPPPR